MSLLKYFQPSAGCPNPMGSLSSSVAPRAIARANQEVDRLIVESKQPKKRGPYRKYTPEIRAAIGKYANTNGVHAALRFFSRKLKHHVSASTMLSIKKAYVEERRRRMDDDEYPV